VKAADITKGAVLLWQPRKYGMGERVRVLNPRTVYGRTSRYSREVADGFGSGVLVEVLDNKGKAIRRDAAQLRHLIGPYNATVKRLRAEERAEERARAEASENRRRADVRLRALERKTRRVLGVTVYGENNSWGPMVKVDADVFAAMVEELGKQGWKAPEGEATMSEADTFMAEVDENACPECETGTVVQIGPQCRETGHTPYGCTRCRWTS
jgi:hypothetical protein